MTMTATAGETRVRGVVSGLLAIAACFALPAPQAQAADGCAPPARARLVVNVKDKGAMGDGETNDTAAIQKAIDAVGGTGGTVYVPRGTYMVGAASKKRLKLKSDMTLKLADGAVLKAIPNSSKSYAVLTISGVSDVTVTGGALEGERAEHKSKVGEWGMGIRIVRGSKRITVSGVTAKEMWGDGFYVQDAADVAFCGVIADHNRRQGLSIVEADRVIVTDSVFQDTRGTRPSAGIDLEPDKPDQTVKDVRIEDSKFINNAGGGIQIAGKRGRVSNVEIARNVFKEGRPILVENAPAVKSTKICDNRHIGEQEPPSEGLNAFAEAVEVVSLQANCQQGRDLRFEVKRDKKKKKKAN
jgi:translation initiation factor IF-1